MPTEKICENCGKPFLARGSTRKYCSHECYSSSIRTEVEQFCQQCGKPYLANFSEVKKGRSKYCSHECQSKSMKTSVERTCGQCGKKFFAKPSMIKRGAGKFCSYSCRTKAKNKKITKKCAQCGKEFQTHRSQILRGQGKYCSQHCVALALSEKNKKGPRDFKIKGPIIEVLLSRNLVTIIDLIDIDLTKCRWYARRSAQRRLSYACRYEEKGKPIHMHRVILERKLGRKLTDIELVDHINNNPLDNRRSNLRPTDASGNAGNQRKSKTRNGKPTTSIYKGVSKHSNKWCGQISVNGKNIYLGCFFEEIQAAKAYDTAARKYFGEFANLNFPKKEGASISQQTLPTS